MLLVAAQRPPCSPCGSKCNYNPAEGWGVCLPDLTCFGAIDGNAPAVTCPTKAPTLPPTLPPSPPPTRASCSPCGSPCGYSAEGWGVCLPDLTCFEAIDGNVPPVTCPKPSPIHGHGGVVVTPPLHIPLPALTQTTEAAVSLTAAVHTGGCPTGKVECTPALARSVGCVAETCYAACANGNIKCTAALHTLNGCTLGACLVPCRGNTVKCTSALQERDGCRLGTCVESGF